MSFGIYLSICTYSSLSCGLLGDHVHCDHLGSHIEHGLVKVVVLFDAELLGRAVVKLGHEL